MGIPLPAFFFAARDRDPCPYRVEEGFTLGNVAESCYVSIVTSSIILRYAGKPQPGIDGVTVIGVENIASNFGLINIRSIELSSRFMRSDARVEPPARFPKLGVGYSLSTGALVCVVSGARSYPGFAWRCTFCRRHRFSIPGFSLHLL